MSFVPKKLRGGGGGKGGLPTWPGFKRLGSLSNYDDDDDNLKKKTRFNDKKNRSARVSRFLVHFFDVHCTTTT